jgi:hypothetical protein
MQFINDESAQKTVLYTIYIAQQSYAQGYIANNCFSILHKSFLFFGTEFIFIIIIIIIIIISVLLYSPIVKFDQSTCRISYIHLGKNTKTVDYHCINAVSIK